MSTGRCHPDPPTAAATPAAREPRSSAEAGTTPDRPTAHPLTHDDLALLRALATDNPVDVIARQLGVSERTLRRRSRALFDRIGASGRIEAAVWAARRGLVGADNGG